MSIAHLDPRRRALGRRSMAVGTWWVAVVLAAATLAACGHRAAPPAGTSSSTPQSSTTTLPASTTTSSSTTTTTTLPVGYRVGIESVTFTDPSRTTENYQQDTVISDDRVITTEIRYPTLATGKGPELPGAPPAAAYGPFPVIVFAHGYAVMPDTYQQLLDSWVEAGYIVVAPVFPVSSYFHWQAQGGGVAPEDDIGNQPGDIAFVLTQLEHPGAAGAVSKSMDLGRLALAGQSDGATTVAGLEFFSFYRTALDAIGLDPKAIVVLSGGIFDSGGVYEAAPSAPAVLDVQSDTDTCNTTGQATTLYNQIAPTTPVHFFLTLHGADHIGPYEDEMPWAPEVRLVTTMFLELELGSPLRRPVTAADVIAAGVDGNVASMSTAATINLPDTEFNAAGCGVPQPGPAPQTGAP